MKVHRGERVAIRIGPEFGRLTRVSGMGGVATPHYWKFRRAGLCIIFGDN